MENVNHLFLFKGKPQTKIPVISPNVSSPPKPQAMPWTGLSKACQPPLVFCRNRCSRCTRLELRGRHDRHKRRSLVCKSPLSSCPPAYVLNVGRIEHSVPRWMRMWPAGPCYRAVTLLIKMFSAVQPACPTFPMATSHLWVPTAAWFQVTLGHTC